MQTTVIRAAEQSDAAALERLARAIEGGALAIIPTETVYGIAAAATRVDAVDRLRAIKNRGSDHAFTVHLAQPEHAGRYLSAPTPLIRRLARKAWPGPLTIVADERAPEHTQAGAALTIEQRRGVFGAEGVSLRCPDHAATAALLARLDMPIVAGSAQREDQPLPFTVDAALENLRDQADFALDGGRTRFNGISTIVSVSGGRWSILRPGVLDERTLRRMATTEVLFVCTGNSCRSPLAEFMLRHKLARALELAPGELDQAGYRVSSAGTWAGAGGPASSGTLVELERRGIDARGHRSQPLTVELIQRAERIYCMTEDHRSAVIDLAPAIAGRVQLLDEQAAVPDPMGGGPDDYRRCAEHIERLVDQRLAELLDEDRHW